MVLQTEEAEEREEPVGEEEEVMSIEILCQYSIIEVKIIENF